MASGILVLRSLYHHTLSSSMHRRHADSCRDRTSFPPLSHRGLRTLHEPRRFIPKCLALNIMLAKLVGGHLGKGMI
jgi:hypothetical protein